MTCRYPGRFRGAFVLAALFWAVPMAPAQAACVTNATEEPLVFTIDAADSSDRAVTTLAPGAELCLSETGGAVLRVFASVDELEGCSRIVEHAGQDVLVDFRAYDNCTWASDAE